ncbi:conserved hypothetical protein [Ricinus communis]|uniref:Uncharacterized protein n=1 Tax=Ricinus communis TaxID=3988 RepID=B9S650_RICCO|nr:conserved hypothetical protein [Ricinus communis]
MDKKENSEDPNIAKLAAKEIKGVVDEPPPSATNNTVETHKKAAEERDEEVKRLPHQQVPQPGDFSTEALEQL